MVSLRLGACRTASAAGIQVTSASCIQAWDGRSWRGSLDVPPHGCNEPLAPHQDGLRAKQEGSSSSHGAVPGTALSPLRRVVSGDAVL